MSIKSTAERYRWVSLGGVLFCSNLLGRGVEDCTVQYDYIQVVQQDCIQFCDIIKAKNNLEGGCWNALEG